VDGMIQGKKQGREFLVGTVLGDTSLIMNKRAKEAYVYFGHAESQKEYAEWKTSIISSCYPIGFTSCKAKGMTVPYGQRQPFYKYWSSRHHRITAIYKRMYIDGKKRITDDVIKWLSPVSIAVLFMDDGCKETAMNRQGTERRLRTYKISLGNFPIADVDRLSTYISKEYDLLTRVYLEHNQNPCLKICGEESRARFRRLVEPYMHNSMMYKLYL
jgi:recombination protein RecA